ncbi:MAG: MotA/TolQ/ExbB proton channel family protein [Syntrophales bacterium]
MDLATIIGIVSAFSLVLVAVASGGGLSWFLDGPSALIVLGGTFGAVLVNYPLADVLGVIKVAQNAFFKKGQKAKAAIELLVMMSKISRRDGMLALQNMTHRLRDPFLIKAVNLLIDGLEPPDLTNILDTELDFIEERHRLGAEIFTTMGNYAPAMGMTGTLIGLVQMLMRMNDPSSIGPAMSVALVTTFYGVVLAYLLFLPLAGKLKRLSAQELLVKQLIINGILSIQAGDNPRILEQKLHAFISPHERKSVFK